MLVDLAGVISIPAKPMSAAVAVITYSNDRGVVLGAIQANPGECETV